MMRLIRIFVNSTNNGVFTLMVSSVAA